MKVPIVYNAGKDMQLLADLFAKRAEMVFR